MKKLLLLLTLLFGTLSLHAQQTTYYTKDGYVFALDKETLNRAVKYVSQGDDAALESMLKAGKIYILNKNVEVYVEEQTLSLVKIRPEGMDAAVWTVREAISRTKQ